MKRFLRSQFDLLAAANPGDWLRFNAYLVRLGRRARDSARSSYRVLEARDLVARRRSERVFVFGSGYSLNDLTPEDWQRIRGHDTIGFNAFVFQRWIPVGFHLVRGWGEGSNVHYDWRKQVGELAQLICENPCYTDTVFLLQDEHFAQVGRTLVAERMLPEGASIAFYRTARHGALPTTKLELGLQHLSGTLSDAVNLAFCLGWREIVLVGVDLYDTRYFWLNADETSFTDYRTGERKAALVSDRGQRYDEPHSTARHGVVGEMELWRRYMEERGVVLTVYNPRSLLAEVLPVFDRSAN